MLFSMGAILSFAAASAFLLQTEASESSRQTQWQLETTFALLAKADRCTTVASFRKGGEQLRIGLEARPTSDQYDVLIDVPGSLGGKPWVEGDFTFGGEKPERDIVVIEASTRPDALVYQLKMNRGELKPSSGETHLKVRTRPKKFDLNLGLPQIDAALSQLDGCASMLLQSLGFTQESQRQIESYPRPERNLYTYASSSDYPSAAVAAGAMGEAYILVWVGDDGRASNCRIVRSSGRADIDTATCNIVTRRVRFVTGRDLKGNPVSAPAYLSMRWELPR